MICGALSADGRKCIRDHLHMDERGHEYAAPRRAAVVVPIAELAACNDAGEPALVVTSVGRLVTFSRIDGSNPSFTERKRLLEVMDRTLERGQS